MMHWQARGQDMAQDTISISAGRDYNTYDRYEFCVFDGEKVVIRKGGFSSNGAAKRAGIKAANEYLAKIAA
jgi:hypothetical protein